jgi:membrane associated rhomboid family serine protease
MAPFAGLETVDGVPARVMRLLYEHPGRLFNYAGLRAYKEKWGPRWEPRYLVVQRTEDLPAAALAVTRLGELPGPGRWSRAGAAVARRPVTTTFLALQLWLMGSSALAPQVHAQLLAAGGSSWDLLVRGQLWRLLTSPVVQASPGWVWVNLLLGAVAFTWAEGRLGSRRTAAVFFLGDLVGSVPVLLGTRLLAALGVGAAAAQLSVLDGGSSAGTWALLGSAVWASTSGRRRRAAVAGLLVVLLAALVLDRGLADIQHLASVAGTLTALAVLPARAVAPAAGTPGPRGPRRSASAGSAGPGAPATEPTDPGTAHGGAHPGARSSR